MVTLSQTPWLNQPQYGSREAMQDLEKNQTSCDVDFLSQHRRCHCRSRSARGKHKLTFYRLRSAHSGWGGCARRSWRRPRIKRGDLCPAARRRPFCPPRSRRCTCLVGTVWGHTLKSHPRQLHMRCDLAAKQAKLWDTALCFCIAGSISSSTKGL